MSHWVLLGFCICIGGAKCSLRIYASNMPPNCDIDDILFRCTYVYKGILLQVARNVTYVNSYGVCFGYLAKQGYESFTFKPLAFLFVPLVHKKDSNVLIPTAYQEICSCAF